jgi:rSAM/selenodomain-associated transferase 1
VTWRTRQGLQRPDLTLLVIAKTPVPGRVKTRLTPQVTPWQACTLAVAALHDTLAVVASAPARRRLLVLDGEPGRWIPAAFEVVPQVGGGLADRLAGAFALVDGPAFLVGMDTPQLTVEDLWPDGGTGVSDAVIGPAEDGGYWGIGMREPRPEVFAGVPMSTPRTGELQRESLRRHGFEVSELRRLRDVDTMHDARAVASLAPSTRFAAAFRQLRASTERQLAARANAMS